MSASDRAKITAYVLGELSPEERTQFQLELERRPELRALVETRRRLVGDLENVYLSEKLPGLSDERKSLLRAAWGTNRKVGSRVIWAWVGAGALVALLLLFSFPKQTRLQFDAINSRIRDVMTAAGGK